MDSRKVIAGVIGIGCIATGIGLIVSGGGLAVTTVVDPVPGDEIVGVPAGGGLALIGFLLVSFGISVLGMILGV